MDTSILPNKKYIIVTDAIMYFVEYINSIFKNYDNVSARNFKVCYKESMISINNDIDNVKYIINMEQCNDKNIELWLSKGKIVLNYNLYHINKIKNENHLYLPYQINIEETSKLGKFCQTKKEYDVVICSVNSKRRSNIYYDLYKRGVNVKNVKGWGDNRDIEIGKGKILLNIHFNHEYKINESLRCDRWATSGLLVITENSKDDNDLDIKELLIIEKYEKLVDKIIEVLSDYNRYYKEYMEKLLEKIESIRELRNVEMKKVLEKIEYG